MTHTLTSNALLHAADSAYLLGRAMRLQARFWYEQQKFEEAKSEVLGAVDVFEKLTATKDVEDCRKLLQDIEWEVSLATTGGPGIRNGGVLIMV